MKIDNIQIKIRRAKKEDVNQIHELGRKTKELNFSTKMVFHDKIELKEFVHKPATNILLVASYKKKIIGFLYAKIVSCTWCILDNLAVDLEYRKHGIGNLILHQLYIILRKDKVNYIQILEEIHHKNTRKFWHAKGFREEKVFVWADKNIK